MTALQQLTAGALRRGRGNLSEEGRQLHDEMVRQLNLLRAAILELDASGSGSGSSSSSSSNRVVALHSFCDRSSGTGFYAPFGNVSEHLYGSPADEEVQIMPPFGSNSRIVSVHVLVESNAGSTSCRIAQADETLLQTESLGTMNAGDYTSATFNYAWDDGQPKIIGVNPTTNPNSVAVMVVIDEAA